MALVRISNSVYNVGVLDPFLRKNNLNKECPFGTTYNSYLIDDRTTALIDIPDSSLYSDFQYNLGLVCDIGAIDYLILNRIIPQHAESIERLLKISPKTTIVCTEIGKRLLDNILHCEYSCVIVNDGDKLNLGNSMLEFIATPMLPTPDSMCTYFENDGVLFSGCMFSADFCEPNGNDESMRYIDEYIAQLKDYFNFYFIQLKGFVNDALNILEAKTIYTIAPLNGPVVVENTENALAYYREWAVESKTTSAVVLYHSTGGYTKQLANAVFESFKEKALKAEIIDMNTATAQQCALALENASFVAVGSGTINRDAPTQVWKALSEIMCINTESKSFFAFGSYGWTGEGADAVDLRLRQCGFSQFAEPFKVCLKPTSEDIQQIKALTAQMIAEA
ncbi:MAG: FprA family A-type flavoprotein [Acutalibacteraceae bacterium]|nr:FprA family A-type flavoprotein [Acutalibacteraceae bacterium]